MSGPKCYDYWVDSDTEDRLREQLRRQREIEEINFAKRKYRDLLRSIDEENEQIKSVITKIEEIELSIGRKIVEFDDIKCFNKDLVMYVEKNKSVKYDTLHKINEEINCASEHHRKISENKIKVNDILLKYIKEATTDMDNKIDGSEIRFTFLEEIEEDNPYIYLINNKIKEIENLVLSKKLYDKRESIKKLINEITSVNEYKALFSLIVLPFINDCVEYDCCYNQLFRKYEILVENLGVNIIQFDNKEDPLKELEMEIDKLEKEILEKEKKRYVCNCLEESMEELGYTLVGTRSVEKKSGKKFVNRLYRFDEGTVVNITIQDNGQISLELGGVDTVDRSATIAEATELVNSMEKFCADNKKIQKSMRLKGIKGNNISVMPPSIEYAQIINVKEYQLNENLNLFKSINQSSRVNKRKTKNIVERNLCNGKE